MVTGEKLNYLEKPCILILDNPSDLIKMLPILEMKKECRLKIGLFFVLTALSAIILTACGASNWENWLARFDTQHIQAIEDYAELFNEQESTEKPLAELESLRKKAMNIYFDLKISDADEAERFLDAYLDTWISHGSNLNALFKQKLGTGEYDLELSGKVRAFNEDYVDLQTLLGEYNADKVEELKALYKERIEGSVL